MIRVIQRRLIIPRGDTGTFSIPMQGTVENGDIAVFAIYDPMIKTTLKEIRVDLTSGMDKLEIPFKSADTVELPCRKYLWDIKIYKTPTKYKTPEGDIISIDDGITIEDDFIPVDASEINSYYAAFSLPICEIKEVTQDV